MEETNTLFDAAIVNEDGVIENILVFDNEETMHEFGAKRLADGQAIGDIYVTPDVYEAQRQKKELHNLVKSGIMAV